MRRVSYTFAIASAVLLVAATALQWHLIDAISVFLIGPLLVLLWLAFIIGFGISAKLAIRHRNWQALACLAFCTASGVAAGFDPFTPLWLRGYFHWYEAERERAVRLLMTDELPRKPHNRSVALLPDDWSKISMGGNEVIVQEHGGLTYVLFFTFRGILDSYAGYLYVPDGGDPRRFMDLHEETTQLVPMKPNWVYVSHH